MNHATLVLTVLALASCAWYPNREVAYRERATGSATVEEVDREFGPAAEGRTLDDGRTVRVYRYEGVASPMLLDIVERYCIEYTLTFDRTRALRGWTRHECPNELPPVAIR